MPNKRYLHPTHRRPPSSRTAFDESIFADKIETKTWKKEMNEWEWHWEREEKRIPAHEISLLIPMQLDDLWFGRSRRSRRRRCLLLPLLHCRFCLRFMFFTSRTILLSLERRSVAAFFSIYFCEIVCIFVFWRRVRTISSCGEARHPIRANFCVELSQMKSCMVRIAYTLYCLHLFWLLPVV